jgi:16S rRNA (guanine(527)-N(7))-methyltransferase RsmG
MSISTFSDFPELERHYELLCRWNKVLNLTRVDSREEAIERHYGESLFLADRLTRGTVADVGSGAGFPGFVVAVARPDCQVTLIESHQRKAVFLREASRSVPNIRILTKRAEEIQEVHDWLVSRAVSYSDLTKCRSLGRRLALLTGSEEPPPSWGLTWTVEALPGGRNRFLRVSRETGKYSCFT